MKQNHVLSSAAICLGHLVLAVLSQSDPCQSGNHEEITENERSSSYVNQALDFAICDQYSVVEGNWYRFKNDVGGKLPEACVPINRCKTYSPIWMNGVHPTVVGTEVTRTVCANYGFDGTSNSDRCCEWSANIKVKLCSGNYYVYRLVPPEGCDVAYCVGSGPVPCPPGQVYNGGICQQCPIQQGDPTLSNPIQLPAAEAGWPPNDFEFTCTVAYPEIRNQEEQFEVRWLFDLIEDGNIPSTILNMSTGLTARLRGTEIDGHMGTNVQCVVRSFIGDYQEAIFCPERYSNAYRMEILAETDTIMRPIVISNPDTFSEEIQFSSTIPPTCSPSPQTCAVDIVVQTISDDTADGESNRVCRVRISSTSWDATTSRAVSDGPFRVVAERDTCGNANEDFVLHFGTVNRIDTSPFKNYDITDIRFRYNRLSGAMCKTTNDPWIKTFDGHSYPTLKIGKFYLVRSSVPNAPNSFEIQVRMNTCGTNPASCNCAVAIREGDTVLGIDHCNQELDAPIFWEHPERLTAGSAIYKIDSETYKACTSSGACIKVQIGTWGGRKWINVFVENLPRNLGPITGLCGDFDGDKYNDNTDVESHRIRRGKSLFSGYVPSVIGSAEEDFERCTCEVNNGDQIRCGPRPGSNCRELEQLVAMPDDAVWLIFDNTIPGGRRRKKDAPSNYRDNVRTFEGIQYQFDYGEGQVRSADNLQWPTASGTTEEEARRLCRTDVESAAAFDECLELVGQEYYDSLVADCVNDFKIRDSLKISGRVWETLQEQCLALSRNDESLNSLQEAVVSQTCPGRCSGNGVCSNRICSCSEAYIGPDCSASADSPPVVTSLQNNGLCDVEKRPCRRISLYSKEGNFVELDSTVCKVTNLEVTNGNRTTVTQNEAIFVSKWEIICPLPDSDVLNNEAVVARFGLSLSYDGSLFSTEHFVTVLDSVCMECTGSATCSQKPNTCSIDGRCYLERKSKEGDTDSECRPDVHGDKWTCVSDACITDSGDVNLPLVVGCAAGGMVLLLIAAIVVVVICRKKSRHSEAANNEKPNVEIANPPDHTYERTTQDLDSHTYSGMTKSPHSEAANNENLNVEIANPPDPNPERTTRDPHSHTYSDIENNHEDDDARYEYIEPDPDNEFVHKGRPKQDPGSINRVYHKNKK